MAKKMIIKGVGSFMAKRAKKDGTGTEVITMGTLQDLRIDLATELEDIFGGDGLFAIDTLVRTKSIEITATDAKFDMDALQVMMGSTVQEQVEDYVWVLGEEAVVADDGMGTAGEVTPAFGGAAGTIYAANPNFQIRLKESNTLLNLVTTAPAGPDEVQYDATTQKLVFDASLVGQEVVFNYQRTETVDLADLLVDEVPFPLHVVHHGSFLQKDGSYAGIETEIYQARASGTFSIDTQRTTASSTNISLRVIDPERADGKLGTIKRYSSATRV